MEKIFRSLTADEIVQMTAQGCTCEDWSNIQVSDGFNAASVRNTQFSGKIQLGKFDNYVTFFGGVNKRCGISNARIHNCIIGDDVYIDDIGNYIANYVIEDGTVIENVDLLAVEGQSSFGNGVEVAVVNEAGGREVPIYDFLSAHTAYLIAFYRHRGKLIENLKKMISDYTSSVKSSVGIVGKNSKLINCRIIKNVKIGPASVIEGINRLENGSINSYPEEPVYIGPGVSAENFIISCGSEVSDGAIISKCFIGQGTILGKHYSAENSVFFANCGGFHGEACSVFAGPYTVTHHKSTLLIAGLFSFLNAGSGTNQSNHMYKFGPVHQGVVERGSKTGSDSYMLWPAKVGAFTVVMGRHYRNSDTSDLPFSYLIEHEDESVLIPAVNLRSVGTVRDAKKWPKRDRRKGPRNLDFINFKLLSPYTVQKMLHGCMILENLKATSGQHTEYFTYHSVKIRNSSLEKGIQLYQMGADKFLGNCLLKRLEAKQFASVEDLRKALIPETKIGRGKWLDLAGLFAPEEIINSLLEDIENGKIKNFEQLTLAFKSMHENYPAYEWAWAAWMLQQKMGKCIEKITPANIIEMVNTWKDAVIKLDRLLYEDAQKEFAPTAQMGFGIDGDEKVRQQDFEAVRGNFEENSFVKDIEKHIISKQSLGDELINRIRNLG